MNDLVIREYLGNGITFKDVNGQIYANATEMAKCFPNKNLSTWINSKGTEEYIEAMCIENNQTKDFYLDVKQGGVGHGTWIHETLCLDLARWLNTSFRIWCDKQISTLIREGSVSIKPKSEESMLLELFPNTDNNLILLTANTIRDNKKLTIKIKEDEPKVNFADRITNSSDAIDIGSFVKVLHDENIKIGRNKFFDWLRVNKYLMSNNIPYQKYIDNGYFKVIETVKKTVYGDKLFPKTLITGKAQLVVAEKLRLELGDK